MIGLILCISFLFQTDPVPDSVFVSHFSVDKDSMEVTFCNASSRTQFIFDTYFSPKTWPSGSCDLPLTQQVWFSDYLHRFNEGYDILSFLPLFPYLRYDNTVNTRQDMVVLGGHVYFRPSADWLITHNVLSYHFIAIEPQMEKTIRIPMSAVLKECRVRDIDVMKYKTLEWQKIPFAIKKKAKHKSESIIIQFAVYDSIDLLTSKDAFYFRRYDYDEQAHSFRTISLIIKKPCLAMEIADYQS